MRRFARVTSIAAVLACSFGFVPVTIDEDDDTVCVVFRDVVVPGTPVHVERPTETVCAETPTTGTILVQR